MGHGGRPGPGQCLAKEHHGGMDGGPARCGRPSPCPGCAQCRGGGKEGRGEVRVEQPFKMNPVYHPHINAMASPFPPHVFWHFSLGHAEVSLCFPAPPSLQGPTSHFSSALLAAIAHSPLPQSCAPSLHFSHAPVFRGARLSFCIQTSAPRLLPCALSIPLFLPIEGCPTSFPCCRYAPLPAWVLLPSFCWGRRPAG